MIAVFTYNEEEVKKAIFEFHQKKIEFSSKNYKTEISVGPKGYTVTVENIIGEPKSFFSWGNIFRFLMVGRANS